MTDVIAHRGASRLERENTLAAFHRAREVGADWVELDVRLTADRALAVHHDDRFSDGRPVHDVAATDLPQYVPLLADALDACDGMGVNIEIKSEPDSNPAAAAADLVAEALAPANPRRFAGPTVISSFDLVTVDRARQLGLTTAYLVVEAAPDILETLTAHGHRLLHPWDGSVTESLVAECHRRGVGVNVWTVDDPDRMRELAAWGVDGICTNVPDVAVAVLRQD